ncbi:Oleoyl-acyl carrier protein [Vigna angularis]|uniref:Acyl-[acyl-carrier-protein] hydrolase n=1 Tax=Phaseolus angularis TaxID=3914 RepID=A0A8T0KYL4_PHAAN|nr:Oleoyl-acyl carrier protein [Vigna angularis]
MKEKGLRGMRDERRVVLERPPFHVLEVHYDEKSSIEVGCNHAQSVGYSTDGFATTPTMRKLRLIWVTARMHIEIYKYPACKWVMMNQDTRRLQKVSDDVREEVLVYCPREPRLAIPEEDSNCLKKIPKLEDPAQYSKVGLVGDAEAVPELKATNGSAISKEAKQQFLHLLRLSTNGLEINRGRTEWRKKAPR